MFDITHYTRSVSANLTRTFQNRNRTKNLSSVYRFKTIFSFIQHFSSGKFPTKSNLYSELFLKKKKPKTLNDDVIVVKHHEALRQR